MGEAAMSKYAGGKKASQKRWLKRIVENDRIVRFGVQITLRDYFAAKALLAFAFTEKDQHKQIAKWAYGLADAMLQERKR